MAISCAGSAGALATGVMWAYAPEVMWTLTRIGAVSGAIALPLERAVKNHYAIAHPNEHVKFSSGELIDPNSVAPAEETVVGDVLKGAAVLGSFVADMPSLGIRAVHTAKFGGKELDKSEMLSGMVGDGFTAATMVATAPAKKIAFLALTPFALNAGYNNGAEEWAKSTARGDGMVQSLESTLGEAACGALNVYALPATLVHLAVKLNQAK